MYECESWIIKKAEHWRIDAFELWSWRRLLRVPWTARRSNQSILKEIRREYSLEVLMLKLKLEYLGHLMQRTDSLEKTLMLGKIGDRRRRGWERKMTLGWHHQLDRHEFEQALGVGDGQGSLACCSPWSGNKLDTTGQLNWTEHIQAAVFIIGVNGHKNDSLRRPISVFIWSYTDEDWHGPWTTLWVALP